MIVKQVPNTDNIKLKLTHKEYKLLLEMFYAGKRELYKNETELHAEMLATMFGYKHVYPMVVE